MNKRTIIFCIILAVTSALLQSAPPIPGDEFSLAVFLSGLPIFIGARISFISGITVFLAAISLSAFTNVCEPSFLFYANGFICLTLGILKHRFKSVFIISALSASMIMILLFIINYCIGISIFDAPAFKTPISQAIALFPILFLYCLIYLKLGLFADSLIHRNIDLNIL